MQLGYFRGALAVCWIYDTTGTHTPMCKKFVVCQATLPLFMRFSCLRKALLQSLQNFSTLIKFPGLQSGNLLHHACQPNSRCFCAANHKLHSHCPSSFVSCSNTKSHFASYFCNIYELYWWKLVAHVRYCCINPTAQYSHSKIVVSNYSFRNLFCKEC